MLICYHGAEDIKVFKKECKRALLSSIYSVVGTGTKVKLAKKRSRNTFSPTVKKNIKALKLFVIGMIFVCTATAMIVVM